MPTRQSLIATLALLAISSTFAAKASTVLFDNGGPLNGGFANSADSDSPDGLTIVGNVFTPLAGTANTLTFAGVYVFGAVADQLAPPDITTGHFEITLYATASNGFDTVLVGSPTVVTLSNVTRTPVDSVTSTSGRTVYSFTGSLGAGLTFQAGTSYFLGISDVGDGQNFGVFDGGVGVTAPTTTIKAYSTTDGVYHDGAAPEALSFSLSSTPEPSSYIMAMMGLATLTFMARRRAKLLAK